MMRIENVRLGHATSSSSSHSIVFTTRAATPVEPDDLDDGGWYYGWDNFRLTDLPSKMRYLAVQVYEALRRPLGHVVAAVVVRDLTGINVPENSTIDHESTWCVPTARDGWMPDRDFVGALRTMLAGDNVVICGGSDNPGDGGLMTFGEEVQFPLRDGYAKTVLRRNGTVWTLYNACLGAKVSMVFDGMRAVESPREAPDLIDLKITDRCHRGCPWCYQDSSAGGTEGEVYGLARLLGELGAFEVVIGGGEPTTHQSLITLIDELYEAGMSVSLTSGTLDWARDAALVMAFRSKLRALAFSVQKANEVDAFVATCQLGGLTENNSMATKRWIHVIPAVVVNELGTILQRAARHGVRVLLLGWKASGRAGPPPHWFGEPWIEVVQYALDQAEKRGDRLCVAVDTLLAHDHEGALKRAGVSELLYRTREGVESAYYDAVTHRFGPSSYEPQKMVQIKTGFDDDPAAQMREEWRKWQEEGMVKP